jgi:hypothetical protein
MHINIAPLLLVPLDQPPAKLIQALQHPILASPQIHALKIHILDALVLKHGSEVKVIEKLIQVTGLLCTAVTDQLAEIEGHAHHLQLSALEHEGDIRVLLVDDLADALGVVISLVGQVNVLYCCESFGCGSFGCGDVVEGDGGEGVEEVCESPHDLEGLVFLVLEVEPRGALQHADGDLAEDLFVRECESGEPRCVLGSRQLLVRPPVTDDEFLGPLPDAARLAEDVEVEVLAECRVAAGVLEIVAVGLETQLDGDEQDL